MIEIVRSTIPIESSYYHDTTRLFDLDTTTLYDTGITLETLFKSIEMPQMFFQKMTARQILNTIFKYINAISRLVFVEGDNDKLTVDFFNKLTGSFTQEDILDFKTSQDISGYATKAISWLQNSLQSGFRDNPSIKTPATNRFKTVRAKDVQLTETTNGYVLPLEKSIYELSKIIVRIPKVSVVGFGGYSQVFTDYEIDITTRVIQKKFWDLKTRTVDFPSYASVPTQYSNVGIRDRRNSNFYWEKNTTEINPSLAIGSVFHGGLLYYVIEEAVAEEFTFEPYDFGYLFEVSYCVNYGS